MSIRTCTCLYTIYRSWWQGKGGLGIGGINKFIPALMQVDNLPDYIVVCIDGNDIGNGRLRLGYLHLLIELYHYLLHITIPGYKHSIPPSRHCKYQLKTKIPIMIPSKSQRTQSIKIKIMLSFILKDKITLILIGYKNHVI